jgi:hypothetical protein
MLAALTSLLLPRKAPGVRPILLRLAPGPSSGGARTVELALEWRRPAGAELARARLQVSDGMCLLPWRADAEAVRIEGPGGPLEIARAGYGGEVVELP